MVGRLDAASSIANHNSTCTPIDRGATRGRRAYAFVLGSGRFSSVESAGGAGCHQPNTLHVRRGHRPVSLIFLLCCAQGGRRERSTRTTQDLGLLGPCARASARYGFCWFTVYPSTGRGTYLPLAAMRCPVKASRTCVLRASESSSLSSPENSGSSLIIYQVASVIKMSHVFKLSSAKTCLKI